MSEFVQGQRWVVDSEPELGLGTVIETEGRHVKIFFDQADCERTYAINQAPLTRIRFAVEDEIKTVEGELSTVIAVHEQNGLCFYELDDTRIIPETSLSSEIQLNQPFMRLMTGQLDKPRWFHFKRELSAAITRLWQSRLNGLLGIRANLIPHQLSVAWNACEHQNVRVLLADEVGLGKTIEAGMILSRLIKLERAERVLVAVPAALQVQWLIELVRRFSLTPELFKGEDHDFTTGQIHIVPHAIFGENRELINEAKFDLIIVDEAHHLTPESEEFKCLADLSETVNHLVLLTATPEQLGIQSHFARLNLLDPAKFPEFDAFVAQEERYIQLNQDIKELPGSRAKIIDEYQLDIEDKDSDDTVISQLLDSHGVGRVVFRNVRSATEGFPSRIAQPDILENDSWEAKYEWLGQWLKANKDEKVLVICHDIQHVGECENYLWQKHGFDAAVFHEEQDLIERDRAAAYFADEEDGARLLICSEIGSEGRNFQFCSHLVCLDLPEHPDLLEQRIGRLDRIGQKNDVQIHIPFAEHSNTQVQFKWFNDILECVEQQNPAASAIHDEYWPQLEGSLENTSLVTHARDSLIALREEIKHGRDALLEMNSCRQPDADNLRDKINEFEQSTPLSLVETASELLQFHFEETQNHVYSVIPSDKMLVPALPGLPPEGTEITFSRDAATQREDIKYIGWDSAFIVGLWDLLHYSELGSAAVAMLPSKQLPAGHCLVESCFDLIIQSDVSAACRPYLSTINLRTLALDISDNDLTDALPESALQNAIQDVKRHLGREIIQSKKEEIPQWFRKCEAFAETKKTLVIEQAVADAKQYYTHEIQRLETLNKRNKQTDMSEINLLQSTSDKITEALTFHTQLHLSAIRLIVITDA
ncbi:MAG: DEAD/DEAH box helicase family protein [Agarilytica sp.]